MECRHKPILSLKIRNSAEGYICRYCGKKITINRESLQFYRRPIDVICIIVIFICHWLFSVPFSLAAQRFLNDTYFAAIPVVIYDVFATIVITALTFALCYWTCCFISKYFVCKYDLYDAGDEVLQGTVRNH